MPVLYVTPGPWGPGLGTTLDAAQIDNNFWDVVGRLVGLETRVKATGVLTLIGNAVAGQTVTIGSHVYTWRAAPALANEVKIGATASISIDNLVAAINGAAGEGTLYGTGTQPHSTVIAAPGAGDTMDVEARVAGEFGNTIVTTETMTNGSWGSVTLTGGLGIGPDMIESIQVIGSQMTFFMQSGDTFGPFTLPVAMIKWRGEWADLTDYAQLDLFIRSKDVDFPGVYLTLIAHESESPFDPARTIDGNGVYHKLFAISGTGPLNFRGVFAVTNYAINDMFIGPDSSYVVLQDHTSVEPFDPDLQIGGLPVYTRLFPAILPTDDSNLWDPVELATTANVALTGEQTIDGVLTAGTPVLVRAQTLKQNNGIYETAAGTWTRRADADAAAEFEYAKQVLVMNGTTFGGSIFYLNTVDPGPYVIGTTPLVFNELAAPDRAKFLQLETAANVTLKRKRHTQRAVRMNRATAQNFNMDGTDGFGAGRGFDLEQIGAGAVTVVASGGVVIEKPVGMSLTLVRYVVYEFYKINATTWRMSAGVLAASGVPNDSSVSGTYVKDALETLAGLLGSGIVADYKASVRAATTANITISTALNNGDTIDGVTLATNDRVLVKNQSAPEDNGIYVVGVTPARATDFDSSAEVTAGTLIPVAEGTVNADRLYLLTTNDPITLGTTGLSFSVVGGNNGDVRYDTTGTFTAGQIGTASHPTDPTNGGTFKPTIDATHFNLQWFNNNVAAFTFAAPDLAGDYTAIVDMINGASAGTVSYSGWTKNPSGDALTTTNGHKFRYFITKLNGNVSADIKALQ